MKINWSLNVLYPWWVTCSTEILDQASFQIYIQISIIKIRHIFFTTVGWSSIAEETQYGANYVYSLQRPEISVCWY